MSCTVTDATGWEWDETFDVAPGANHVINVIDFDYPGKCD